MPLPPRFLDLSPELLVNTTAVDKDLVHGSDFVFHNRWKVARFLNPTNVNRNVIPEGVVDKAIILP